MQPMKTAGLVISLQKTIFNGTFDTMVLLQDKAAELNDCWVRNIGVSPQINPSMEHWYAILKKGRTDLKRLVETQFSNMESIWSTAETSGRDDARVPSATHPGKAQASV